LADIDFRMATLKNLTGAPAVAHEYTQNGMNLAEALNRESPGNKRVLNLLAIANATVGDRLENDDSEAAQAAYLKCKAYQSELVQLDHSTDNRLRLVRANVRIATAASRSSRLTLAAAALAEAESQMSELLAAEPKNPIFQRQMALTYQSLSFVNENPEFPNIGDSARAIDYARRYVAVQKAQADTNPDDANAEFSLAMALLCQSRALRKASPPEALDSAKRALELIEKNLARSPGNKLAISRRARVLMQLGLARLTSGDRQGAREAAVRGLEQQREVAAALDDNDERRVLLWAFIGAAEALDAAGERGAATRHLMEATSLAETALQRRPMQLPLAIPASHVFRALASRAATERGPTPGREWLDRNARVWREAPFDTPWVQQRRLEAERLSSANTPLRPLL
jgi:hypothetical protein